MGSIQKCLEMLQLSIREVFRQRARYFGVTLAIALGTAGLIVVITVGRDVKANLNNDLDLLGEATRVKVIFQSTRPDRETIPAPRWFKHATVDAVKAIPGVSLVSPAAFKNGPAFFRYMGLCAVIPSSGWMTLTGSSTDFLTGERTFLGRKPFEAANWCAFSEKTWRDSSLAG